MSPYIRGVSGALVAGQNNGHQQHAGKHVDGCWLTKQLENFGVDPIDLYTIPSGKLT